MNQLETFERFMSLVDSVPKTGEHIFHIRTTGDSDKGWSVTNRDKVLKLLKRYDRAKIKPAFYINSMTGKPNGNGKIAHSNACFESAWVLVLDDVGDPSKTTRLPKVPPTWKIETSDGSEHWGYMYKEPIKDFALAKRIINAAYKSGLSDSGGNLVGKFVRAPVGVNGKDKGEGRSGFEMQLIELNPENIYDPLELVEKLGLTLEEEAPVVPTPDYTEVIDPIETWLRSEGMVIKDGKDYLEFECPWVDTHSKGTGTTAGYSPKGRGKRPYAGDFKCFHSHHHNTADFVEWVADQGGYSEPDNISLVLARVQARCEFLAKEHGEKLVYHEANFTAMVQSMVYDAKRSKFIHLNEYGKFIELTEAQIKSMVLNVYKIAEGSDKDYLKKLHKYLTEQIIKTVVMFRQVESSVNRVDMFGSSTRLELLHDGVVERTYKHKPLKTYWDVDDGDIKDAITDYRKHFPQVDEFLDALVDARFANSAREAFLWLHCVSSWGKGVLMNGVLGRGGLGIVTAVSASEIEAAFDGKPIGLDIDKLYRSWVLFVDEFKGVKSEFKQLDREITGAAKNRMRVTMDLYMKVFASAETVDSLAGEYGIEEQFSRRFSYITGEGVIDERQVYLDMGAGLYIDALRAYCARRINARVKEYRAMGKQEAGETGVERLHEFHERHHILKAFSTLAEGIEIIVDDLREIIRDYANGRGLIKYEKVINHLDLPQYVKVGTVKGETVCLVTSPSTVINRFLEMRVSKAELRKIGLKNAEIADLMDIKNNARSGKRILQGDIWLSRKGCLIECD